MALRGVVTGIVAFSLCSAVRTSGLAGRFAGAALTALAAGCLPSRPL